jgi:Uncharacterized protein conserved in bacteria
MVACLLIADAADYVTQPYAPIFGGGSGPLRRTVKPPLVENVARQRAREDPLGAPQYYRVWFATSRALIKPDDPSRGFANKPDPAGVVRYGTCTVQVPKSHRFGSTGTWYWRWLRLRFSDDHLKIVGRVPLEPADFFDDLRRELTDLEEPDDRVILVYLHGYNVSFNEAAIRAAQIGVDLKVPGVTAFFSWPSWGSIRAYMGDASQIVESERQITEFLTRISTESGARSVHLIAHSMGNRGLARSIQRITAQASVHAGVRFGQIILAAPDIEVGLFRDLAAIYPAISDRTTMYVSARDRVLGVSKWLAKSDRAGYTPPVTVVPRIDTIEVTDIDLTMLGHGYFAEAEAVLYDINYLLLHNDAPDKRPRLKKETTSDGLSYWVIQQ